MLNKRVIREKNFVTEYQHCELKTITIVEEDGVEISRSNHMETIMCGDDNRSAVNGISNLTSILWTRNRRDGYEVVRVASLI